MRSPAQDRAIWAKQADGLANRMTQNLRMNVRKLERQKTNRGRALDLPQLRPGIYHNNPARPMPGTVTPLKAPAYQAASHSSVVAPTAGPLPRNQDTLIPRVERPTPLPRAPGERMTPQV